MVAPLLRTFGEGHAGRLLCYGSAQCVVAENAPCLVHAVAGFKAPPLTPPTSLVAVFLVAGSGRRARASARGGSKHPLWLTCGPRMQYLRMQVLGPPDPLTFSS